MAKPIGQHDRIRCHPALHLTPRRTSDLHGANDSRNRSPLQIGPEELTGRDELRLLLRIAFAGRILLLAKCVLRQAIDLIISRRADHSVVIAFLDQPGVFGPVGPKFGWVGQFE